MISRKKPKITAYNNPERYEYSSRYESVGRDYLSVSNNSNNGGTGPTTTHTGGTYYPRLAHKGAYTQVSSNDELVECLRVLVCTTTTNATPL